MIVIPLSIVLHYCPIKTSELTFIRCHNSWFNFFCVAVTTSVRAPSCHDNVRVCSPTRLSYIHYINSDLCRHFLSCGYGRFLSLRCNISYMWTMSAYDFCITFSFFFVSTLWRRLFIPSSNVSMLYPVLSPSFFMLDSILSPLVSLLEYISSWFDLALTTFPTVLPKLEYVSHYLTLVGRLL